jgi:hypothetical protein
MESEENQRGPLSITEEAIGAVVVRPIAGVAMGSLLGTISSAFIPTAIRSIPSMVKKDYHSLKDKQRPIFDRIKDALFYATAYPTMALTGGYIISETIESLSGEKPEEAAIPLIANIASLVYEAYRAGTRCRTSTDQIASQR